MSNDTTTKKRPTHRVYSVRRPAKGDSKWTEIGAAWPHKDGQGFNLKLDAMPAHGAEVVLRTVRAKKGDAQ
jgi:hypothetical protein